MTFVTESFMLPVFKASKIIDILISVVVKSSFSNLDPVFIKKAHRSQTHIEVKVREHLNKSL